MIHKNLNDHIYGICQWISTNEVSKCAEINCSSFDNLYFPLEDVNIEIWILKATDRKLLLSSILSRFLWSVIRKPFYHSTIFIWNNGNIALYIYLIFVKIILSVPVHISCAIIVNKFCVWSGILCFLIFYSVCILVNKIWTWFSDWTLTSSVFLEILSIIIRVLYTLE